MKRVFPPVIGLVTCSKQVKRYAVQVANEWYIDVVKRFGGLPILLPSSVGSVQIRELLRLCDGILFPGSHSNIEPRRYGANHHEPYLDKIRDDVAIDLIRAAIDTDKPCLGICRGFQEMNVALGGTLNPFLLQTGYEGHGEADSNDFSEVYAPSHSVWVEKQGLFSQWLEDTNLDSTRIEVNSLHDQGIERLAPGLLVEAKASDGLVEAFSLPDQKYFIGVQWHPEWNAIHNSFSQLLFRHFMMAASNQE
ncbi:gamma-glutamyl-gamma-aminobutyrate hydrolase family protein [Vibrio sp. S4M6]|uniref:gamma-glutamyl-gamma-aminobutyrate hydrolase family protein n=1 Tax=Vibrio sinus TaxID=2946865 RepID=UPI00202A824C|nr:gamma-glutamyl-gamma-aminobutyrate hydrolase family protein [Vibrio sinus]MCL9781283.1 gamma-glutamyl-gamma-aminobutyrate hydrolase family protein [Vibrio sinus]